ncbi:hypothetical protein [Aquisphaera insulae]|uniref:hypothetical protein n=1 Tax=Aquisphaera insulae TaxID=2712864 RepID=UPI0013EC5A1C|nr:hypothetical protein [Aquisphaera insulae]
MRTPACFEDRDTRAIIDDLCRRNNIDTQLIVELCEVVEKFSGSGRKEGLASDISTCIDSYLTRSGSAKK